MSAKNAEFKGYTSPKRIWQIFWNTLRHPKQTFETTIFQWKEAWVFVLSFLLLYVTNDFVRRQSMPVQGAWQDMLFSSVFTFASIWLFLSLVMQVSALIFGGRANLLTMMGSMAYSLIPMIPLTALQLIVSLLNWGGILPNGAYLDVVTKVLSGVGYVWAWPGVLCVLMLENIFHFGYRKAIGVLAIVWAVVVAAWFLPQ